MYGFSCVTRSSLKRSRPMFMTSCRPSGSKLRSTTWQQRRWRQHELHEQGPAPALCCATTVCWQLQWRPQLQLGLLAHAHYSLCAVRTKSLEAAVSHLYYCANSRYLLRVGVEHEDAKLVVSAGDVVHELAVPVSSGTQHGKHHQGQKAAMTCSA
jgi:hypothetical protein